MTDTLVLLFHPSLAKSKTNAALVRQATVIAGLEVIDMYALYGDGKIDADLEVKRLLNAERVVLQFPIQWYSSPALLQTWKDIVLTRMFYIAYENEGKRFEGTPLLIAATAGNTHSAYSPSGINRFSLDENLTPFMAMAGRCGLPWADPFFVYEAGKLDEASLEKESTRYADHLRKWIAESVAHRI